MNKEEILECFFKDREPNPKINDYCNRYRVYLTDKAQQPANFERNPTITSRASLSKDNESISNTLSLCSAFSRMTIDQTIYGDIITNRKKHDIFLALETEDSKEKKWHYMDEKGNIYGLYSSLQMNDLFRFFKLNEKCKVKRNYVDDDYVPLKLIIKRYYKKILSENLNIDKGAKTALSKKTQEFRKGSKIEIAKGQKKESFKNQGRVQRVLSEAVRPNLVFLDDIIEEGDSDDEDDQPQTRIRSLTTATK